MLSDQQKWTSVVAFCVRFITMGASAGPPVGLQARFDNAKKPARDRPKNMKWGRKVVKKCHYGKGERKGDSLGGVESKTSGHY